MAGNGQQLAGLGSRAIAAIVDTIVVGAVGVALVTTLIGFPSGTFDTSYMVLGVLGLGYFVGLEAYNEGQTLGKKLTNIRVTTDSGGDVDLVGALVRNVLRVVDALPFAYVIGIVLVAATGNKQRIGDMAGKTVVVKA